jgi:hypothetical protein
LVWGAYNPICLGNAVGFHELTLIPGLFREDACHWWPNTLNNTLRGDYQNSEFSEKFGILQPLGADEARKKDFAQGVIQLGPTRRTWEVSK